MSIDASLELQGAIVAALKADATLSSLIAGRIFDHVPMDAEGRVKAKFPYVSFGPEQDVPEHADCIDLSEMFLQIDAWSREPGYPEVKRVAKAVEDVLQDASLTLSDNALVYIEYEGRRVLRASDGLTSQAAMTFRAVIEKI